MASADNPQIWRNCAEEARVHAEQAADEAVRSDMLQIAVKYEANAQAAELRNAQDK